MVQSEVILLCNFMQLLYSHESLAMQPCVTRRGDSLAFAVSLEVTPRHKPMQLL